MYSESDNALLRYGRLKFSKMAAGRHLEFDPTGNGAVGSAVPENPTLERRPRKPHPRTKHEVYRMTRR